ncbi:MAG: phage major capsid protein [Clostridia bacterium]|nr:phage major capsid protein [Clostridia bacterium]
MADLKELSIDQIEERKSAIVAELDNEGVDLDALEAEMRSLNEEIEARKATEAKKAEIRQGIAEGNIGVVTVEKKFEERENIMTNNEVRATKEYVDAFARYLVSEDATEVRSLLTENVSGGSVPVPAIVDDIIRTAWEKNDILSRVRRTNIRGNLKVAFERVASGAVAHTEGSGSVSEETLKLGIVTLVPATLKKFVRVSDEAVAMGGEEFVRYVYDEVVYQITKKLADDIVTDIKTASTSATSVAACVAQITSAPTVTAIASAYANLSDEATDPVIIMNKLTYANFVSAQAAANYSIDPFMNLPVVFNNSLPAYGSASSNAVYAIVGDLNGESVNYPEGDGVALKYDDLTEAEDDMVKIVGRQYVAHALTACGRFTNIKKGS